MLWASATRRWLHTCAAVDRSCQLRATSHVTPSQSGSISKPCTEPTQKEEREFERNKFFFFSPVFFSTCIKVDKLSLPAGILGASSPYGQSLRAITHSGARLQGQRGRCDPEGSGGRCPCARWRTRHPQNISQFRYRLVHCCNVEEQHCVLLTSRGVSYTWCKTLGGSRGIKASKIMQASENSL